MKKATRVFTMAAAALGVAIGSIAIAGPASAAQAVTCSTYGVVGLDADHSETTQIPKTSTSYSCTEEYGASNTGVRALQHQINLCYTGLYAYVTEDGVFGINTFYALRLVQASIGVPVDGVYGPTTRSHMKFFASNLNCYPVQSYVGF